MFGRDKDVDRSRVVGDLAKTTSVLQVRVVVEEHTCFYALDLLSPTVLYNARRDLRNEYHTVVHHYPHTAAIFALNTLATFLRGMASP